MSAIFDLLPAAKNLSQFYLAPEDLGELRLVERTYPYTVWNYTDGIDLKFRNLLLTGIGGSFGNGQEKQRLPDCLYRRVEMTKFGRGQGDLTFPRSWIATIRRELKARIDMAIAMEQGILVQVTGVLPDQPWKMLRVLASSGRPAFDGVYVFAPQTVGKLEVEVTKRDAGSVVLLKSSGVPLTDLGPSAHAPYELSLEELEGLSKHWREVITSAVSRGKGVRLNMRALPSIYLSESDFGEVVVEIQDESPSRAARLRKMANALEIE